MSKVIAATIGIGGTGTALTSAYALGFFGGVDYEIPEDLETFKGSNGGDCVREVFSSIGGEKLGDGSEDVSSTSDVSLETSSSEKKGCLVVNWDKWKANDNSDKWRGNFRFLWSFSQGNKGFIVYTSASTLKNGSSDAEFSVEGIAYVLEKQTGKDVWTIGKKLKVDDSKKLKKEDWNNNKLPKQGTALSGFSSFWNLLKEDLDKDKLCESKESCNTKESSFRGYWSWQTSADSDKKKLGDWSSNLDEWWKAIYDSDNSKWSMKTLVDSVEGKWVEKRLSSIPTIQTN